MRRSQLWEGGGRLVSDPPIPLLIPIPFFFLFYVYRGKGNRSVGAQALLSCISVQHFSDFVPLLACIAWERPSAQKEGKGRKISRARARGCIIPYFPIHLFPLHSESLLRSWSRAGIYNSSSHHTYCLCRHRSQSGYCCLGRVLMV